MSDEEIYKAAQSNFCDRFKRTINIKETIDGDRYTYKFHSLKGNNDDAKSKFNLSQTAKDSNLTAQQIMRENVDRHYHHGRLYGSYFSLVADPPNKIIPVQGKAEQMKLKHIKSDHSCRNNKDKCKSPRSGSSWSIELPKTPNNQGKRNNSLKLNFSYHSSGKKKAERCSREEDEDSDVSSVEELEVEYSGRCPGSMHAVSPNMIQNMFGCCKVPEFAKYIPVPYPAPLQLSKLPCHSMFPQEWKDAQRALEHDQVCDAGSSSSETQVSVKKSSSKSSRKLGRLTHLLPRTSLSRTKRSSVTPTSNKSDKSAVQELKSSGLKIALSERAASVSSNSRVSACSTPKSETPSAKAGRVSSATTASTKSVKNDDPMPESATVSPKLQNYRRPARYPHPNDSRFDETLNLSLVEANTKDDPNFCATLYVEMPVKHNMELCHIKTEMAVSAMLNFFHPYNNVQCFWISNIGEKLQELLKDRSLRPKFSSLVHLRRFDAILVLSNDAGNLLKHRNTCFLHSLACALQLSPHKLLVLARNPWWCSRPATAPR